MYHTANNLKSGNNISVLYVEDDASLAMVTREALERQGYQVAHCKTGVEAIEKFLSGNHQICLIDVLLPDIDGYSLAKVIRSSDQFIPLLFISGKNDDLDRLEGYKAGGDDYISKPYSIEEVVYKIEIFYKRSNAGFNQQEYTTDNKIGKYVLEPDNYTLKGEGLAQKLTFMETNLLAFLIRNKNKLVKRNEILTAVWGTVDDKASRSLDVFISRLRKFLQDDQSVRLESHKGVGYKLSEMS